MISFDKAVIDNIYRVHSILPQWDKAVVVFQAPVCIAGEYDTTGNLDASVITVTDYNLTVLYANTKSLVVKQESRRVNKKSIIARYAELEFLGTKKENPEYFL